MIDLPHAALGVACGALVGLTLGLIGGGGSILSVPLMVYVIGVANPHVAIGTSALSVAANAVVALAHHARTRAVNWRCGAIFATGGLAGAALGAAAGKAVDSQRLLLLFALVMIVVALLMFRTRRREDLPKASCNGSNGPKVASYGAASGLVSGFFGIGGGFLIVPGLIGSTRMATIEAVATSLVAVTAFGLTTAASYAVSGLVDWGVAATFVVGGFAGAQVGALLASRLSDVGKLSEVFAGILFLVASAVIWKSLGR